MNSKVDFYFTKAKAWQKELEALRTIVFDCNLYEELKWGCPCYTITGADKQKDNVVLIHAFKNYCALLFFKGVLLKDTNGILIQQTEHVQAARQLRFTNYQEILKQGRVIKAYIFEAIEIELAGLKVPMKKTKEFQMPAEFKNKLNKTPSLKKAFYALTPGRQRGYLLYFSSAKQSATREARIEKSLKSIMMGKGLDD